LLAESLEAGIVDTASGRDYASGIALDAQALGSLIDDSLELSRIEAGEIRGTIEQVDIAERMQQALKAVGRRLPA
jgi:signal transduction histidine kinase